MIDHSFKKINLNDSWRKYPVVAFDTETSGAYAVESEIIELGAVKWFDNKIVDRFQTLLKPSKLLSEENMRIHGITNLMVANAPLMSSQIVNFKKFIDGSVLLAHHAPFDLGFLTLDFENQNVDFPNTLNLCSSLISRALLPTTNHKLQTLVKELQLTGGDAHRAFDDAYACLQVLFKCLQKISPDESLLRLMTIQGKDLSWENYTIKKSNDIKLIALASACATQSDLSITYLSGQTKSQLRKITPLGIVRNPDGDYVHAFCHVDNQRKRFYIDKIIL